MSLETEIVDPQEDAQSYNREAILLRVAELEQELLEFQESSKDLELALEDELKQLELDNDKLVKSNTYKDQTIKSLKQEIKVLKRQLVEKDDLVQKCNNKYETDIKTLKQKLVDIEITNDNIESNDRVLSQRLEILTQFNGELLEKIAILENDLHLERVLNNENKLVISNYENKVVDLTLDQDDSGIPNGDTSNGDTPNGDTSMDTSMMDVSLLSMRDVLRDGPKIDRITKSESSKRISDIRQKNGQQAYRLSTNLQSLRQSAYFAPSELKSPAAVKVSDHSPTSNQPHKSAKTVSRLLQELDPPEPKKDELKRKKSGFRSLFR